MNTKLVLNAVHNGGKLLHETVLGTKQAIKGHAELMKKFPEMEHPDANMAHVQPGKAGEIVWQFAKPGEFEFACLQPGLRSRHGRQGDREMKTLHLFAVAS